MCKPVRRSSGAQGWEIKELSSGCLSHTLLSTGFVTCILCAAQVQLRFPTTSPPSSTHLAAAVSSFKDTLNSISDGILRMMCELCELGVLSQRLHSDRRSSLHCYGNDYVSFLQHTCSSLSKNLGMCHVVRNCGLDSYRT